MDDLNFTQGVNVRQGHRVCLDACVTKAWGSSCEVKVKARFTVHPGAKVMTKFADVRFVYVILKTEKERTEKKIKVKLPKLNVDKMTFYQKKEWELAEKRKKYRRNRAKLVSEKKRLSIAPKIPQLARPGQSILVKPVPLPSSSDEVSVVSSKVEMWELVLPLHANHMGNTFGGQIMCWMSKAAFEAAWKLVGYDKDYQFIPVCVDQVLFLAPSHVGDRLQFVATVTRVFTTSLEVKISVFGGDVTSNEPTLINEAFLTYVYTKKNDDNGWIGQKIDPHYELMASVEYSLALGRRALRLQRNAMQNLVRTFKDLDTTKDGLLSKEELVDALKSGSAIDRAIQRHGHCSQAFLKHLLATNDKAIDFETFNNAVETFFSDELNDNDEDDD